MCSFDQVLILNIYFGIITKLLPSKYIDGIGTGINHLIKIIILHPKVWSLLLVYERVKYRLL